MSRWTAIRRETLGRQLAARVIAVAILLAATGAAVAAIGGHRDPATGPVLALKAAHGAVKIKSSHQAHAILTGSDMAPGDKRTGKVKVSVDRHARVWLRIDQVDKQPGPQGGVLAKAMWLKVRRMGAPGKQPAYNGPLKRVRKRSLGVWDRGESRRYRVRVKFPASESSQDALQGAGTAFRLLWRAKG
jgi:hypothetical protein